MKKTQQLAKTINDKYKYVIYMVVFAVAVTIFTRFAQSPTQAQTTPNNLPTQTIAKTPITNSTGSDLVNLKTQLQVVTKDNPNPTVSAQTPPVVTPTAPTTPTTPITTPAPTSTGPSNAEKYQVANISTAARAISDLLAPSGSTTASGYDPVTKQTTYTYASTGSPLESLINYTGQFYINRPASVQTWADDLRSRFDPSVYAQNTTYNPGQGYNLLKPILGLWTTSRNMVYLVYIIIIVVLAFLILFRNTLGGQEAVTLFNAIPSIIISLLLVTFSYPLSAVFIDLVTVGSGVVYGVLITDVNGPGHFLVDTPNYQFITYPTFGSTNGVSLNASDLQVDSKYTSIWQVFQTANINPTLNGTSSIIPSEVPLYQEITHIFTSITGNGLVNSILSLVFIFAAFTASLKLFFSLMAEYVILIAYPIVSPFVFLVAAIPNQTGKMITDYFKRLLAAALSFVAVYGLFLVIIIISRGSYIGNVTWVPPLLGYTGAAATADNPFISQSIIRPLIGYALFISAPLVVDFVKQALAAGSGPSSSPGENIKKTTQAAGSTIINIGRSAAGFLGVKSAGA